MKCIMIAKVVPYHHSHKNKEWFLKVKRRNKSLFYFYDDVIIQAIFLTSVRNSPANEITNISSVLGLSFLIVWISDTVNMVLLVIFSSNSKMAVHSARKKKKICEMNNFWYFFFFGKWTKSCWYQQVKWQNDCY